MSEFKLHCAIKRHIERCFIGTHNPGLKFWHVANENRDSTQGFWNREMGQLAGVLDFQCGWPVSKAGVLEVKFGKNKLTPDQNRFISWAKQIGWHTGVAYSVQQAHWTLCTWGLKPAYSQVQEPDLRTDAEKKHDAYNFFAPLKSPVKPPQ